MLWKRSGLSRRERPARVGALLEKVGLAGHGDKYPAQLSGGMQQRVQIARCLAQEPRILLMDEPFGALDALTRQELQDEITRLVKDSGATTLFVTHDLDEAIYLGDRVFALEANPGRLADVIDVDLPRPRDQLVTREQPGIPSAPPRFVRPCPERTLISCRSCCRAGFCRSPLLVVAEIAMRATGIQSDGLALPSQVATALLELIADGEIFLRSAETIAPIAVGVLIGGALGLLIGVWLGLSAERRAARLAVDRIVPPDPAGRVIPLTMLIYGIGRPDGSGHHRLCMLLADAAADPRRRRGCRRQAFRSCPHAWALRAATRSSRSRFRPQHREFSRRCG